MLNYWLFKWNTFYITLDFFFKRYKLQIAIYFRRRPLATKLRLKSIILVQLKCRQSVTLWKLPKLSSANTLRSRLYTCQLKRIFIQNMIIYNLFHWLINVSHETKCLLTYISTQSYLWTQCLHSDQRSIRWFRIFNKNIKRRNKSDVIKIITELLLFIISPVHPMFLIKCDRHRACILTDKVQVIFRSFYSDSETRSSDITCKKNRLTEPGEFSSIQGLLLNYIIIKFDAMFLVRWKFLYFYLFSFIRIFTQNF